MSPKKVPVPPANAEHERDLLAALLDVGGALVIVLDPQGRIVRFNRACEILTGYASSDMLGRLIWDHLLSPEDATAVRAVFDTLVAGSFPNRHENYWLTKDGGRRFISWSNTVLTGPDGRVRFVIGTGIDITEQRRAESDLRASETRHRQLIEGATDGIVMTDDDFRIVDANPRAVEMLGYSPQELTGMSGMDLMLPEDVAAVPLQLDRIRREGRMLFERQLRRRDGSSFNAEISAHKVVGGPTVAVIRDVTERARIERALRESEEQFRRVVESNMMGVFFAGPGGVFTEANDHVLELIGYRREDLDSGRINWYALSLPEDAAIDATVREELRSTGLIRPRERHLRRADGTRASVLIGGAWLRREDATVVCFVHDLTQLRRTEQRLAESQIDLERAQSLAHVGSWQTDPESRTVVVSKEFASIFGLSPDTARFTYEELGARIHPEDVAHAEEQIRYGLQDGHVLRYEYRIIRPDGEVRVIETIAEAVRDGNGNVTHQIGSVQDITERRLLEMQLREAQRLEAIGRLAGGVAHDFNNLLTVILGSGELLLAALPERDPGRLNTEAILAASRRAASLTQQLLAFGRRQMLRPSVFDLNLVVADLCPILERLIGERFEVLTELNARHGLVRADRGQIEQVIMNLAINARDAMPEGGRLVVATGNADGVPDGRAGEQRESSVLLTVSDTGVGMSPEVQAHIFEPFYTTKPVGHGTGLGLATVYGIVTQSGGRIDVDSSQGGGTTFRVYLPCAEAAAETEDRPSAPAPPRGRETLLLVEDEPSVRELLASVLRRIGYRVLEAGDGQEALRVAAAHSGPLDLLITDVVMPGLSGFDLARRLEHDRPALKVLLISGYSSETTPGNGITPTGENLLQKPFGNDALARKVRDLLDLPPGRKSR